MHNHKTNSIAAGTIATMKGLTLILLLLLLPGCSQPAQRPEPGSTRTVQHVVIVSIDGLRPDLLTRTFTPNIRSIMRNGSFTFWANTTESAITLPSHVSMLTGATPDRHEIFWNSDVPAEWIYPPAVPTLFEVAEAAGHTTAMTVGKSKFVALQTRETPRWAYIPDDYADAMQVAEEARKIIIEHRPTITFIHFPDVDAAGHGSGWGSLEQLAALERCDGAFGLVLAALSRAKMIDSTVILVTSDHGGAGVRHGPNDPRSRHIPWLISGPGIRKNHDLTLHAELTVNTEDTFATVCHLLNLRPDEDLDGKPITQILINAPQPELLRDYDPMDFEMR